ncbi:MAG: LysE family translocator [Bacteriovoracaceae bacterium]
MPELLLAATFGLSGGISPGPLLALIIGQTINYGFKEGLKTAMGPLLTDAPIILGAYFFTEQIPAGYLNYLYFPGGVYLLYLARHSWKSDFSSFNLNDQKPNSIRKGVIVNLLNPAPYVFWLTIGAPTLIKTQGALAITMFFAVFYLGLIGAKVLIAWFFSIGRENKKILGFVSKILGAALGGYGVYFLFLGTKSVL